MPTDDVDLVYGQEDEVDLVIGSGDEVDIVVGPLPRYLAFWRALI